MIVLVRMLLGGVLLCLLARNDTRQILSSDTEYFPGSETLTIPIQLT